MNRAAITYIFLVITLHSGFAAEEPRNGNWWRKLDLHEKRVYILGVFDGLPLGRNFSFWGALDHEEAVVNSYNSHVKLLSKVTSAQLADGLDAFYSDYRNRGIPTYDAAWVAVQAITGVPKEKVERMAQGLRKLNAE